MADCSEDFVVDRETGVAADSELCLPLIEPFDVLLWEKCSPT